MSHLAMTAIFGALWFTTGSPLWMIVTLFAGIAPAVSSLGKLVQESSEERRRAREIPKIERNRKEKELLRAAKVCDGELTPTTAALKSSCSVEEADEILQGFAERGFATVEVRSDGRMLYLFPEFRPEGATEGFEESGYAGDTGERGSSTEV